MPVMSSTRCALLIAVACIAVAPPALAQFQPPPPDLQNRIPAPLPPPPQPPIINGPMAQSPPPGVYQPPRLNTYSDRITSCMQEGAAYGLRGRKLNSYATACANTN
jgi:hypothetical protein